ncbi:peptidoglycan bridge formation glycyltransferase FemA/FemB family protein [Staphylococcus aureus]
MKFTNLTAKEFGAFTDSMPYSHFTQTVGHYELKLAEGYETHLVGIKNNNNEVIAACLLTAVPVMKVFKYFYSNRGPVIDYENQELVHFSLMNYQNMLKNIHLYLHIDPYLPYQYLNHDGEITGNAGNDWFFDKMSNLGFEHTGFHKGFDPVLQNSLSLSVELKR